MSKESDHFIRRAAGLPSLNDAKEKLFQVGGRIICKELFPGELLGTDITNKTVPAYTMDGKRFNYSKDDMITDIIMNNEGIYRCLNECSSDIVARTLINFEDNKDAQKFMINSMASLIDDVLEAEKNPKGAYPAGAEALHKIIEQKIENGEEQKTHQPSGLSLRMAKQVIHAMEKEAKTIYKDHISLGRQ